MRKGLSSSFGNKSRRHLNKAVRLESPPSFLPPPLGSSSPPLSPTQLVDSNNNHNKGLVVGAATGSRKGKKTVRGKARLWMRLDKFGNSELVECDKNAIVKRVSLPARDFRILGPIFSHSFNILAREKAMVVNLEFIRAIVTAEEVLILDPLRQEVIPFVDQLRQQLPHISTQDNGTHVSAEGESLSFPEAAETLHSDLPFEFQVLEIALEVVCAYLDSSVADLEGDAYPVLDDLARNVSNKGLENVRSLKSNLTSMLASIQKVRDEIEHLLDDNEDMANLYLTRKWIQNQQYSEALMGLTASSSIVPATPNFPRLGSSLRASDFVDENDVEDLEMLLEAFLIQLDGTRHKILTVREYINDTEDYVNIQLNNRRNELIQLKLIFSMAVISLSSEILMVGMFSVNIPCTLYNVFGIFGYVVGGMSAGCLLLFLLLFSYAKYWRKLLD